MNNARIVGSNLNEKNNILNILRQYILGPGDIKEYDSTKTYNTDDRIYRIDPTTHQLSLYVAIADNITGAFDNTKWSPISVSKNAENLIELSASEPSSNTKLWAHTIGRSSHTIPLASELIQITNMNLSVDSNLDLYVEYPTGAINELDLRIEDGELYLYTNDIDPGTISFEIDEDRNIYVEVDD